MFDGGICVVLFKEVFELHKCVAVYLFNEMEMRYFCSHCHRLHHRSVESPANKEENISALFTIIN